MPIRPSRTLSTRLAWTLAAIAISRPQAQAGTAPPHIPAVRGTTLAGAEVYLPQALNGRPAVLVVGFSKSSQGPVAAWGRRLAADHRQSAGVQYYEIALLEGAPRLLRGMIVHAMRSSVPESERSHFLPLDRDEPAWREVTHYAHPDAAYVLLIDGSGIVRWQTEGAATDAAYSTLQQGLRALSSGAVR